MDGTEDQATAADSLDQTKNTKQQGRCQPLLRAQTKIQGPMDASLGTRVLLKD